MGVDSLVQLVEVDVEVVEVDVVVGRNLHLGGVVGTGVGAVVIYPNTVVLECACVQELVVVVGRTLHLGGVVGTGVEAVVIYPNTVVLD